MVRFLLTRTGRKIRRLVGSGALFALLLTPAWAGGGKRSKETSIQETGPILLLEGGRKLTWERSFGLEREVKPKRTFWTKLVDIAIGPPDFRYLVNPYSVTTGLAWAHHCDRSGRQRCPHLRFPAAEI